MHIPGREGGSSQVLFRARGTPTMKLWSFDARRKGKPGYSLAVETDSLRCLSQGMFRRMEEDASLHRRSRQYPPLGVWISAGGCSRLARNRLLRLHCYTAWQP